MQGLKTETRLRQFSNAMLSIPKVKIFYTYYLNLLQETSKIGIKFSRNATP